MVEAWHQTPPISTPLLLESTHQRQVSLPEQVKRLESALGVSTESGHSLPEYCDSSTSTNDALSRFMISRPAMVSALWAKMPDADKKAILLRQVARFYNSYQLKCPEADHLLSLTRVNVHRAFVSNMVALSITWEWMEDDSISPFSMERPGFDLDTLPEKLRPTQLQRSSIYHTWIDLFPCPVMRNNLIRAGNDWDDDELCLDIMGFWDGTSTGPFGLIIWGEPADPRSWEITEGFLKKWGWVIRGSTDLMWSTNYWRARRGVKPLFPKSVMYSPHGQLQSQMN